MLGGEDKKLNFDEIFLRYNDKIKFVVAFGSARKKVLKSANKCRFDQVKCAKNLYSATRIAYEICQEKDTILLSPACTSFDEFNSYAERGDKFIEVVKGLVNAKKQN